MGFWRNFGEVMGAIADASVEAERQRRNREADYYRPVEIHVIDSEIRRRYHRGMVFKTYGFCPDTYVILKEDESRPGSWVLGELMTDHSTMILKKVKMSECQIDHDLVFSHQMNDQQFRDVIRWW